MDVCDPDRVPAQPDQWNGLERNPGAHPHVPESRHAHHRGLQVWLPGRRRIHRLGLAPVQFCLHVRPPRLRRRGVQQGAEEFHGYGVVFRGD